MKKFIVFVLLFLCTNNFAQKRFLGMYKCDNKEFEIIFIKDSINWKGVSTFTNLSHYKLYNSNNKKDTLFFFDNGIKIYKLIIDNFDVTFIKDRIFLKIYNDFEVPSLNKNDVILWNNKKNQLPILFTNFNPTKTLIRESFEIDTVLQKSIIKLLIEHCKRRDDIKSINSEYTQYFFDTYIFDLDSIVLGKTRLNPKLRKSDGPPSKSWSDFWFILNNGKIFKVFTPIIDIKRVQYYSLIETIYSTNDNHFDAIFWLSNYNEDGYILFYNDFKNKAIHSWKYH